MFVKDHEVIYIMKNVHGENFVEVIGNQINKIQEELNKKIDNKIIKIHLNTIHIKEVTSFNEFEKIVSIIEGCLNED